MVGCTIPFCNNSTEKGYTLKILPTDKKRREKWINSINTKYKWTPSKNSCVCEMDVNKIVEPALTTSVSDTSYISTITETNIEERSKSKKLEEINKKIHLRECFCAKIIKYYNRESNCLRET